MAMTTAQKEQVFELLVQRKTYKEIGGTVGVTKGQVAGFAFRNKDRIEDEQIARLQARNEEERRYWAAQEKKVR